MTEQQAKKFLIEYEVECHACFMDNMTYETEVKGHSYQLHLKNLNVTPGTPHPTLLAHLYLVSPEINITN